MVTMMIELVKTANLVYIIVNFVMELLLISAQVVKEIIERVWEDLVNV